MPVEPSKLWRSRGHSPPRSQSPSDEQSTEESEGCQAGTLGCPCIEGLCLMGLMCEEGICVEAEADTSDESSSDTSDEGSSDTSDEGSSDTSDESSSDTSDESSESTTTGGEGNTCDAPNGAFGCEFQAVKLPVRDGSYLDTWSLDIVVGNPGPDDAEVEVEVRQGGVWTTIHGPLLVPAGELYTFYNYGNEDLVPPGLHEGLAYRVRSTAPIVAHQIGATQGATNLMPSATWGWDYLSVDFTELRNMVVVLAKTDSTTVLIQPSQDLTAGPEVPAGSAPFQVLMDEGDALALYRPQAGSLQGMAITSDPNHPVAVLTSSYGTHFAANSQEQLLDRAHMSTTHLAFTTPTKLPYAVGQSASYRVYAPEPALINIDAPRETQVIPGSPVALANPGSVELYLGSWTEPQLGEALLTTSVPTALLTRSEASFDPYFNTSSALSVPPDLLAARYGVPVVDDDPDFPQVVVVTYPTGSIHTFDGQVEAPALEPHEFVDGWSIARYVLPPGMYVLESDEPVAATIGGRSWALSAGAAL
ncbi:hypothetical protein PPSIR1_38886 [Plesiocystis pacifica SIR-1]|uniref:IgGFc-binding protein N-terminal domain-containing protein n=2 Tax=Plesiocystis pacifica TaxID=191768 RepID=A6G8V0_9BACT|nr:hypothetical protein PPSIR1_38886 [Plesiocystis pacifica SIR-1]